MARSDLLINLVKAWNMNDGNFFIKTVEAIISEERARQHTILAERLESSLRANGQRKINGLNRIDDRINNYIYEVTPQKTIDDLILPEVVKKACGEVIEEHSRKDLLRSYNMEPRNRILLIGPPGNGKTSLAEALADSMMMQLFVVRYEGVIGSYLGETGTRLRQLFDHVKTRQCVLFFDEFDTLGKERGDLHETGEIKRVVSTLLLQIDDLPSHVVVIAATNHQELLDRAVWRRFQLRLTLPPPQVKHVKQWFVSFEKELQKPLGYSYDHLADRLKGINFSELQEFCNDIRRQYILNLPEENIKKIVGSCLQQWAERMKTSAIDDTSK